MFWPLLVFISITVLVVDSFKPKECIFPFIYKGQTFDECTDANADFLWCSPTKEYSGTSISCSDAEEQQRLKRDNYYKLFKVLKDTDSELQRLEESHANGAKCQNCSAEVNIITTSLSALTNIAFDHFRKITALKDKFNDKLKLANALLAKSQEINSLALRANRRRNEDVWYGSAPFCSGTCPEGQTLLKSDSSGDGHRCWFGSKTLCRRVYYV